MSDLTLMVLGASRYQLETIRQARALGIRVVTIDNRPENPGHALADRSWNVDTTDRTGVLQVAEEEQVDGIIAPATDVAVPTLAFVARQCNLPGPSLNCAETTCDKVVFREFLRDNGFPCPTTVVLRDTDDIPNDFSGSDRWLLKPDRSSGSKGIFIVNSREEVRTRLPETLKFALGGRAVLEAFVQGFNGTLEGIMADGRPQSLFFLDRQTQSPPYVVTTGHRVPSILPEGIQSSVVREVMRVWNLLEFRDGPFDCDFIATDDTVFLLEMTPRIGGNSITRLLRRATGLDLVDCGIRAAFGLSTVPTGDAAKVTPTGLLLLGVDSAGMLSYDTDALETLRTEDWVIHLELDHQPGTTVAPFINGQHRVGEALVSGETRCEIEQRIDELRMRLRLEVRPQPGYRPHPVPSSMRVTTDRMRM